TRVHGWDVFLRDTSTGDGVVELVDGGLALFQFFLGRCVRLDGDDDLSELAGTTGLLLVGVAEGLNRLADGLTVGNLWVTDVGLNLELALHAVNEDVEVQLAHAADDGLAGLLVQVDGEGGVLFSELLDGDTQLLLVRLGLRLDGNLDNRIREVHRLQDDRVGSITEGVTGGGVLQTDEGVDVASVCDVNRVFLVGVHLEQLADALLLTLGGVQDLLAWLNLAGVNADEGELSEEWVRSD